MIRIRGAVLAGILILCSGAASAQTAPPDPGGPHLPAPKIDPRFEAIERVLNAHGPASPYFGGEGLPEATRTDGVAAMLRFERPLTTSELTALAAEGVEWQRSDDRLVHVGSVYGAFVTFAALDTLRRTDTLVFVEVAWHPITVQPLVETASEIGAVRARLMPRIGATGEGAVIGDIDSGVDVLHPHFFHPDGGAFEWLDTDGDGVFTPGADHVDLDRDGAGAFNEVARVLDAVRYTPEGDVDPGDVENRDDVLDVATDWLYIDANDDRTRNVGLDAGFTELDPGYGEPTFVPDDANRNGQLDPDERVLLLGTSKVRRVVTTERTYSRGEDLIESANGGIIDQVFHGTGVSSILVGGDPMRAGAGIAPGAELVMYASHVDAAGRGFEETGQLEGISLAVADGVDVLVHEWTNPYTAPMDGAGNLEEAMLNARAAGVVQINPLGNMNLSQKHTEVDVEADTPTPLQFRVGAGFDFGMQVRPYSSIYGSIYWRSDQQPTFLLRNPDGEEVALTGDTQLVSIGPDNVQSTLIESLRGTWQLLVVVWNDDLDTSVVQGDWTVEVTATQPDRFVGRIADYWSGWALGVRWLDPTRDHNTAVYPATADAAFGVAAYGGRFASDSDGSEQGELRNYSGRGPRIDGARIVDLAAPDDPYVAWGVSPAWLESGVGRSWFAPFGGTSGAAPHVAGTVALIRGIEPDATPLQIEERLLGSVRQDDFTPTALPDAAWGAGKLDTYAAVFGAPAPPNAPPIAVIEQVEPTALTATGSSDADGDELRFRWDIDYDGRWETDWTTESEIALPDDAARLVRLEVRDGRGGAHGAVLHVTYDSSMEPEPDVDMGGATSVDASTDEPDVDGLNLRPDPDCGCSSAGESATWTLLVVVLVAVRRRR